MNAMTNIPHIPETAPFTLEQRAWLNGFLAGLFASGGGNEHRIRGRTYDFYYSGAHLHMIVLKENGATYWVTNTILDTLSNETMLAIAKGLRPLGR